MSGDEVDLVARLHSLLLSDRGFTLDLVSGQPVLRGVAVCAAPSRTLVLRLSEWSDGVVTAWLRDVRAFVDASTRDDLYLGGWHPTGTDEVHLDVVRVVPAERSRVAEAVGRLHRQRAAFDLTRRAVVVLQVA
jgi:hypothetical protein